MHIKFFHYNDIRTETWFFTEIDRSLTFGALLKDSSWKLNDDELGLAFIANELSTDYRNYLAAGVWLPDRSSQAKLLIRIDCGTAL